MTPGLHPNVRPARPVPPVRGAPPKTPVIANAPFGTSSTQTSSSASAAFPTKIKESFYLELSVLLAAGVDIRGALDIIQAEQPKKYRLYFSDLCKRIVGGATLIHCHAIGRIIYAL